MVTNEQIHRYPRRTTTLTEIASVLAVFVALALFSRNLLQFLWAVNGFDAALLQRIPQLKDMIVWLNGSLPAARGIGFWRGIIELLPGMVPSLAWLALALLVAILLRNSLPVIRTSARGMLVEFAGDWLPVPWEKLTAIKVTEANDSYAVLLETDSQHLTGWHVFYSLLYRFSWRPAFLITSSISEFDRLVQTILDENHRAAALMNNVTPAAFQEDASSPLFRFLLSPSAFFSQRTEAEKAAQPAPSSTATGTTIAGSYPRRISAIFIWGAALIAILAIIRYVIFWLTFLALTFPTLRPLPLFNSLDLRVLPTNWWLLVAAHLLLILTLGAAIVFRNLLPELEARNEGLLIRYFRNPVMVPWAQINAAKVTEFSEDNQVVLIQTSKRLPLFARLSSLLYDGSKKPGLLLTSAISNFEPLLQRLIQEVMRNHEASTTDTDVPIFQSDARSDLLLLSFNSSAALDHIVEESRADYTTRQIDIRRLATVAGPMVTLALLPALIVFADRTIQQGLLPDWRLLLTGIVLFVLSMLEWPLVALAVTALDESTGGGEEGSRAFYLYPRSQSPRILALLVAFVLTILSVPFLPTLLWFGAIIWSFVLAAGLWSVLYDWRGGALLAGGLIPVGYQLLILIGYLLVRG